MDRLSNIKLFFKNHSGMANTSNSAYERHVQRAASYVCFYGGIPPPAPTFRSERDILVQNHRFLRDDDTPQEVNEEKLLARKYYDSLFREYALVDLSRWRERKVALRWRTKAEVLAGQGRFTCGCLSCPGRNRQDSDAAMEELKRFEINFAYAEDGVQKNSLVKVCVCRKCSNKLRKAQRLESKRTKNSHNGKRRRKNEGDRRSKSPRQMPMDRTAYTRVGEGGILEDQ